MGRKFFVGGNWKCTGSVESVKKLVDVLNHGDTVSEDIVEVVVAPSFLFLQQVKNSIKHEIQVAAQNCWVKKGGAFTGEVSAEQLVELHVPYVILGHSERRHILKENHEFVGQKVAYALGQGLNVIACIGETLFEREAGDTIKVCSQQLEAIREEIGNNWSHVVIAYEPVWAIGTGRVATPEQAEDVHREVREWLSENVSDEAAAGTRIIYGGSVTAANCDELAKKTNVDGFLVGGASLKPEFIQIINAAKIKEATTAE